MTSRKSGDELPYAIRMKGGIAYDPEAGGFVAIVHSWDNKDCIGTPEEWVSSKVFTTESAAMRYYKKAIRPGLKKAMQKAAKAKGITAFHRELE